MTFARGLRVLVVGAVFVCALATARPAQALAITLSDSGSSYSYIVTDNASGDWNPLAGIITVAGAFGAFDINVITGITDPILGSPDQPIMELNQVSVNYYGAGTGSLSVSLSDTGYSLPTTGTAVLSSYVGGTYLNGSVQASTSLDLGNALFGSPDLTASNGTYGGAIGSFSNTSTSAFNYTGGNFSLTQTVNLTLGTPGSLSFDLQSTVRSVPEPASAALFGLGFASVLAYRRRTKA